MFFLSLRVRLLLLVLLAVIPALVLVLVAGLEARHAEGQHAQERALQWVRAISRDQEQSINESRQMLLILAQLPALQMRDAAACHRLMMSLSRQYTRYANLGAIAPDGKVFCSAQPHPPGTDATDSAWFRQALESREFTSSNYFVGRITGKAVLTMAQAVVDAAGTVRAVAFASLDLEWLNRFIAESQLPPSSVLTVIDRQGTVLARYPDPEFWVGHHAGDGPLVKTILSQQREGVSKTLGLDRVERLYAYKPLGPTANVNAYVSIGIPPEVAYAESERLMRRNIIGLSLATLLAMAAAWWGGGIFLLRRIQGLVQATRQLAAGDLSVRSGLPYGPSEISQLAQAFDGMAATLQGRQEESERVRATLQESIAYIELLRKIAVAANEAKTIQAALQICLDYVCAHTGWPIGHVRLLIDAHGKLIPTDVWHLEHPERFRSFRQVTESTPTIHAKGLPGRVLAGKKPIWIRDVSQDPHFYRSQLARDIDVRAAVGFPVMVRSEVVAILEFFVDRIVEPDEKLLDVLGNVGTQLGRVIERKRAEERMAHLIHHDGLTELPNRILFNDRLRQAMMNANRRAQLIAVAFLDLDEFKNINDTLGHDVGDMLLKLVAARLKSVMREGDTVARLGGDEFTLVLVDMSHVDDVARIAQKILHLFTQPFQVMGRELFITGSLGITIYPLDDNSLSGLLKNADIAMYRAKQQGKNTYQFYAHEMTAKIHERLSLENRLHRALERHELTLHYQPQVDLRSGAVVGMEALLRWNLPGSGFVPHAQFIPIAEETGMIVPIGEWVLHEACTQMKCWQAQGMPQLRVSVNLSARQFLHKNLIEIVARMLHTTGLAPPHLELELTESILMQHTGDTMATLRGLGELGIQFVIDDFGIGYSSLSYLKRFPVDALKIDQSFVRDIPGDSDDAAIAQAIIAMAHSLGLKVIAEGVETEEQLRFLRTHACDVIQGYYFSQPLQAEDALKFLREGRRLSL